MATKTKPKTEGPSVELDDVEHTPGDREKLRTYIKRDYTASWTIGDEEVKGTFHVVYRYPGRNGTAEVDIRTKRAPGRDTENPPRSTITLDKPTWNLDDIEEVFREWCEGYGEAMERGAETEVFDADRYDLEEITDNEEAGRLEFKTEMTRGNQDYSIRTDWKLNPWGADPGTLAGKVYQGGTEKDEITITVDPSEPWDEIKSEVAERHRNEVDSFWYSIQN